MTHTVNAALREHVTSGAFTLSLRKTHIEAFAYISWRLEADLSGVEFVRPANYQRTPSTFVAGCHGLIRRGLVEHQMPPGRDTSRHPFSEFYTITDAGHLVIGLIKESGLWQEYASAYPTAAPANDMAA